MYMDIQVSIGVGLLASINLVFGEAMSGLCTT